jgi:hypothetical protein
LTFKVFISIFAALKTITTTIFMKNLLSIALFALCTLTACAPQVYEAKNMKSAVRLHHTVAILPAAVNITLRPNQAKKMTQQDIHDMAEKTGYDIQDKMYGWLLRKGQKYNYSISFQDINTTNDKLKAANISYQDMKSTDRGELAKKLGVDAVIDSRIVMDKPMSDGAAVALALLVGVYGTTNQVQTTLNLYDGKSGGLLWKYDYQASGSMGSSPSNLVDAIMRNAAKKIPYRSKS